MAAVALVYRCDGPVAAVAAAVVAAVVAVVSLRKAHFSALLVCRCTDGTFDAPTVGRTPVPYTCVHGTVQYVLTNPSVTYLVDYRVLERIVLRRVH